MADATDGHCLRRSETERPVHAEDAPAACDRDTVVLDYLDDLVRRVFDVSLSLSSCAKHVEKPIDAYIREAIEVLDGIVRNLRTVAFKVAQDRTSPLVSASDQWHGLTAMLGVVEQLEDGATSLRDAALERNDDLRHTENTI